MLDPRNLLPFLSISPFRNDLDADVRKFSPQLSEIFSEVIKELKKEEKGISYEMLDEIGAPDERFSKAYSELKLIGITFKVTKFPGWLKINTESTAELERFKDYLDQLNHLVLVVFDKKHLALICSDSRMENKIIEHLLQLATRKGLAKSLRLSKIPWEDLSKSFVHGPTRGIVLESGMPPEEYLADSRNMAGPNLKFVLRPSDGAYVYSSIVSQFKRFHPKQPRLGISRKSLKVWTSKPKDLNGIADHIMALFNLLEDPQWNIGKNPYSEEEERGKGRLNMLARPLPAADLNQAEELITFIIIPKDTWGLRHNFPERTADENDDRNLSIFEVLWEAFGRLEVKKEVHPIGALLNAFYDDEKIAELEVTPLIKENKIEWSIRVSNDMGGPHSDPMIILDSLLQDITDRIHARYRTGHTVKAGDLFMPTFTPIVFTNWYWQKFKKPYSVFEEFPRNGKSSLEKGNHTDYTKIGKAGDTTLFTYVVNNIDNILKAKRSLLICDHGTGEIADFIHVDEDDEKKRWTISFVHVKKVPSEKDLKTGKPVIVNRQVSITPYYEVLGQCLKSLVYTEHTHLCEQLERRLGRSDAKTLVFNNPMGLTTKDKPKILQYFRDLTGKCNYQIIVLQPYVLKENWDQNVKQFNTASKAKKILPSHFSQFLTLLGEIESNCNDRGVKFYMISEDDS